MALRLGLGPVFEFEWRTASRRWRWYAGLSILIGLVLGALTAARARSYPKFGIRDIRVEAAFRRDHWKERYTKIVGFQTLMVLLVAPAATAGAICHEKARGTLLPLLATDLSATEIVTGKLAARLVPVLGFILATVPVLVAMAVPGEVSPSPFWTTLVVTVPLAILGCAVGLTASLWGRKPHDVLIMIYMINLFWVLLGAVWLFVSQAVEPDGGRDVPDWILRTHPFVLTAFASDNHTLWAGRIDFLDQLRFGVEVLALSVALLCLAVARLRSVVVAQAGRAVQPEGGRQRRGARWLGRIRPLGWLAPTLDGNPILWREWHRQRPSRWTRIAWGLYAVPAIGLTLLAAERAWHHPGHNTHELSTSALACIVPIGLVLLSATTALSLAEERSRGTLDVVLATALPASAIIRGKWWGALRRILMLALLPTLVVLPLAVETGRWAGPVLVLALMVTAGAATASLGLALATWIARIGRVVTASIAASVAANIGWIVLLVCLMPHSAREPDASFVFAMMASPSGAIITVSDYLARHDRASREWWPFCVGASVFWIVIYAAVAGLLIHLTEITFDRCLGRIPDQGRGPSASPKSRAGKPIAKPAATPSDEL